MRLELPENKKLLFTTSWTVRWGDMDAMGHVNNVMYFKYMEHCRVDWLAQAQLMHPAPGVEPVVVNAFCNYHAQLVYPDEVVFNLYASNPGRSSVETWVTMARVQAPEVICASGGATIVWVDMARQKAVALPEGIRQLLGDGAQVR